MSERIVVLLVDDESPPRHALRRAFQVVQADEFDIEVLEAASVPEYHAAIRQRHIDVLVIDLRLVADEEGTDDVVTFHHIHSPDTIIIAFSAFLGLKSVESLQSCVRVMRAGALDCVAKWQTNEHGEEDGVGTVVRRSIEELRRRRSSESSPSHEWVERNLPALVNQFGGKAVAIMGQTVVASADSVQELRREIASRGDTCVPFLMVIPKWSEN